MKDDILKIISKNILDLIEANKDISTKELSQLSEISYSTLAPILRGERDFRITNLVALAKALDCTPNDLMLGLFSELNTGLLRAKKKSKPKYLISFITTVDLSYCQIYDVTTQTSERRILPFPLFCSDNAVDTLNKIKYCIKDVMGNSIDFKEIFLYLGILSYEHVFGRQKLLNNGPKEFGTFVMEQDWMSIHKSVISNNNGILITINNGVALSYSNDEGRTIIKMQGYNFPISDGAGNFWLGCEAIKHTINVVEKVEQPSLLSDRILSLVNSDLDLLATKVFDNARETYTDCAKIVKELAHTTDKAYEIIKQGFTNIWERIEQVDSSIGKKMPVFIASDLAYLYEEFIPNDRLVKTNFENLINLQFEYSTNLMNQQIKKSPTKIK